jgi:hypothetical protein
LLRVTAYFQIWFQNFECLRAIYIWALAEPLSM